MKLRRFFSDIGIAYFLLGIVTLILVNVFSYAVMFFAPRIYDTDIMTWVITLVPMYLVAFPVCAKYMKRLPKMHIIQTSLKWNKWILILFMCLGVMLVGNLMGNAVVNIISNLTSIDMSFDLQNLMMKENLFYTFLFSVILAPVLEEVMFRKVLIDRAIVFGDRTAIFLSGFLFGLFHGNFYQLFYTFGLGCVFAYIYIRTGRLRYTIALHMTINFLGGFLPVLFMRHIDVDRLLSGNSFSDPAVLRYVYSHLGLLAGYSLLELGLFILGIVGLVKLILEWKKLELRPGEYSAPAKVMAKRIFGNVGIWLFIAVCVYMFVMSMKS